MQELRDRLTLSEIVGRRVKLVRAGREFKGCCPFHHEKTPSFYVNDDKQFYHCFGCGAHGDAVGFLMQHGNQSFIEAVETLAAQAGLQVPEQTPQDIARAEKQKDLYSLMDEAARFFEACLRDRRYAEALAYLLERGVGAETISAFRLGFAPADEGALYRHLKEKGYDAAQMIEAGLVRESKRGTAPYSFFRDRVMFPVADRRGRIVAFGGRVLPEHLRPLAPGADKPPKYINSAESPVFHKGRMLYGESHARQAAADGQKVIVVEGYLDVIACWQAGFRGAVAPLGTALTEEQIAALWKMIPAREKIPLLCFDGDGAGRRAAARACERLLPLLQPDHSAAIAFLPEGQDPDSLVRARGGAALGAVLDGAVPLADFLWSHHAGQRRGDTPEDRAGLARALEEEAARIADRGVQHYYRQAFRNRMYETFRAQPGGGASGKGAAARRGAAGAPPVPVLPRKPAFSGAALVEQMLLAALLNHPGLFAAVEEDLGRLQVDNPRLDALRQEAAAALHADSALDAAALKGHLIGRGFGDELALLLSEAVYTHAGFARPGAPEEKALEGWRETCRSLEGLAVWRDIKAAGQALSFDFSAENEEKFRTLYDSQKGCGG